MPTSTPLSVPTPAAPAAGARSTTATGGTSATHRPSIKAPKARHAGECRQLEQLPNIGPSLAADLRSIGIQKPQELSQADAFQLYQRLCAVSGQRQDPCVLDTFLAITDFMRGAPAAPWWAYTAGRKREYATL